MKAPKQNNQLHIESRALTARAQLIDALSVFGTVGQFLVRANSEDFMQQTGGKLDGGVKMAIENTMVNVCSRIDAIVGDESRWSLEERNKLEEQIHKSYQASADLFEKQRALAAEANTPHAKYTPGLMRIRPGMWMAIKGSLENLDGSIVGLGESPKAALDCFDACFNGEISQEQQDYIKKLAYDQEMDQRRNQHTQGIAGGGNIDPGHSPEAQPDSGISDESDSKPADSPGPAGPSIISPDEYWRDRNDPLDDPNRAPNDGGSSPC